MSEIENLLKECWDDGRSYGANMSANNFYDFLNKHREQVKLFDLPVVSNSLVADIRNKLTPPKNLCAMIKALPRHILEDTQFEDLIIREVEQTEKSIEYLSNL